MTIDLLHHSNTTKTNLSFFPSFLPTSTTTSSLIVIIGKKKKKDTVTYQWEKNKKEILIIYYFLFVEDDVGSCMEHGYFWLTKNKHIQNKIRFLGLNFTERGILA